MGEINYLDLVVVSLVLILGIKGIMNGLIKELFGLLGIVGGVYVASRNATQVGELISQNLFQMDNGAMLLLVGFVSCLAVFWIGMIIVGQIISQLIQMSGLSGLDKILGFGFGAGKIFLIFAVIFYALSNIAIVRQNTERYTAESMMYPILVDVGGMIMELDRSAFEILQPKMTEHNQTAPSINPPQKG